MMGGAADVHVRREQQLQRQQQRQQAFMATCSLSLTDSEADRPSNAGPCALIDPTPSPFAHAAGVVVLGLAPYPTLAGVDTVRRSGMPRGGRLDVYMSFPDLRMVLKVRHTHTHAPPGGPGSGSREHPCVTYLTCAYLPS
jgi:hypothetical protein